MFPLYEEMQNLVVQKWLEMSKRFSMFTIFYIFINIFKRSRKTIFKNKKYEKNARLIIFEILLQLYPNFLIVSVKYDLWNPDFLLGEGQGYFRPIAKKQIILKMNKSLPQQEAWNQDFRGWGHRCVTFSER